MTRKWPKKSIKKTKYKLINSNSSKNILGNRVNKLFPNMNKGAKPINIKKIVIIIIIIIIVAVLLYIIVKRTREYKMLNCQNKVNYFIKHYIFYKTLSKTVFSKFNH